MRTKKIGLIVVIACGIMVFSAMNAMAQYNWFTCTVDEAAAGTIFTTRNNAFSTTEPVSMQ